MATTRDELLADIEKEVKRVVPENTELDAETLDAVETAVEACIEDCEIDDDEDEDDEAKD